jgi:hypothetical protein
MACSMLILAEGHKRGLIRQLNGNDWDLTQGFKEMNKYLQSERQALQALGLERRPPRVRPFQEQWDERKAREPDADDGDEKEEE